MHSYKEFIETIQSSKLPRLKYYMLVYRFAEDILTDISNSNQATVASKLNISQPQMSAIKQMLEAYLVLKENNEAH